MNSNENNKEKYLKNLKNELDIYTKELALIQGEFKGKTGKNVKNINHSLQEILNEALIAYRKLKSASADEWEPLKTITSEAFNNLKDSFTEKVSASATQVKEYAGQAGETCQEQLDCVAAYVKEHPFRSVLFAAGAGFILGKIFK